MTRVMIATIIAIAACATGIAESATVSTPRPMSARQQLNACMTKAMTASRTLSYNDASKQCKAQLKSNPPALASNGATPKH